MSETPGSTNAAVSNGSAPLGRREKLAPLLAAPALVAGTAGVAAAGVFLARTLTWPSASSYDAWAYAAWGQALARGEQLVYNIATTPKPLTSVLAAVVSPLPPERAWAVVVAVALGLLVAALFWAGYQEAGALGAAVAAVAFIVVAPLDSILWLSLVDALMAALVMLGVALQGPARIVPFVLAGLLRPEAWLAGALAGYLELGGSRLRRAVAAAALAVLPALLWLAFDFAFAGDALATRHFQEGIGTELGGRDPLGPLEAVRTFVRATFDYGVVFVLVGGIGLLVHAWRMRRERVVPFPLAIAVVLGATLLAEGLYGWELNARYFLPLIAVLALGWGMLAGEGARVAWNERPAFAWAAAAVVVAAASLAVALIDFGKRAERWNQTGLSAYRSLPAVEPVLECGRLGVIGKRHLGGTISQLAAASRTSLADYERVGANPSARYAAILAVNGKRRERLPAGWAVTETPLGPLAANPECRT